MIDLHFHALPGIDDGPGTIEDSLALVQAAAATGTRTIVATPHVSSRYPNAADTIAGLVEDLNRRLAEEGTALTIRTGAEIAMTRLVEIDPTELARLGIGGGRWLLVEPPFAPLATGLENIVFNLQHQGYRVVLAHPERCPAFHRDPQLLEALVQAGVLTSVTAGALIGRFGGEVRRFALRLVREEMVHNVASDAHDLTRRQPGIGAALEQAGLAPLTDWLTQQVPAAILAGEEIPAKPMVSLPDLERPQGTWWRRRQLRRAL